MTKNIKIHVILALSTVLAACSGGEGVNTAQTDVAAPVEAPAEAPARSAGSRRSSTEERTAPRVAEARQPAPALPVYREVSIPAGTELPLELLTSVSSETSTVESEVRARLTRDIDVDGTTALPSGTTLTGVITEAERAGKVKGRSRLAFRFTEAEVRGTPERLQTNAIVLVGEASTKSDAAKIGGGAVAGAVIGGLLGGGKGAASGAAIGGGAGTGVVLATRGKDVERESGASVTATLAAPLILQVRR